MIDRVNITSIRIDGGTQPRVAICAETVREYADAMTEGIELPPVTVFFDGTDYWLADGFHRVAAADKCGWLEIDADVKQGTCRDAKLWSCNANAKHGLRRSNADKRRAVEMLLTDEEWGKWTDRAIAEQCWVDHGMVGRLRSLVGNASDERVYTTKHGTTATMHTANIGKVVAAVEAEEVDRVVETDEVEEAASSEYDGELVATKEESVTIGRAGGRFLTIPKPLKNTDDVETREFRWWLNGLVGRADEISAMLADHSIARGFELALTESWRNGCLKAARYAEDMEEQ